MLSVLEQDYPNIEYIVIDGGSSDGSLEIIQKYADRLAYWQSQKDKGQTDAINQGFARATGEILAWLNSDDILYPDAVSAAVRQLQEHPEVGMVYADCHWINAEGEIIGNFPAAQTELKKLRRGYVHIPQQTAFFRADLWRKVAPLDDSFYFAMDYDLWTRLASLPRCSMCLSSGRHSACTKAPNPSPKMTAAGRKCCVCTTATAERKSPC
jgi:glycosyltransferase involved in cell wall biosynthesis